MATSGAALAFNLGRFRISDESATLLTAIGLGLGKWFRTRPSMHRVFLSISIAMYVIQASMILGALFASVEVARVLVVIAFALIFLFVAISFFVDGLTYAPMVRSLRNALQVFRIGHAEPEHIYLSDGAHLENLGI